MTFEGDVTLARFADWSDRPPWPQRSVAGTDPGIAQWSDPLPEAGLCRGSGPACDRIAAGDVYQVNLCRVLNAALPDPGAGDPAALWRSLREGNPAPFVEFSAHPRNSGGVCESELFLRLADG